MYHWIHSKVGEFAGFESYSQQTHAILIGRLKAEPSETVMRQDEVAESPTGSVRPMHRPGSNPVEHLSRVWHGCKTSPAKPDLGTSCLRFWGREGKALQQNPSLTLS